MCAALPFVFEPMGLRDIGWAVGYAVLLFAARWVLVAALQALPAYVVTPLMNMQFIWMVVIGALAFDEMPGPGVYLGAVIVIAAAFGCCGIRRDQLHSPPGGARRIGRLAPVR